MARAHEQGQNSQTPNEDVLERTVERFSQLVAERVESLATGSERSAIIAVAERALLEARSAFNADIPPQENTLPVSRLKAADVIAQRLLDLSPATLYRGVENKRFYCTTPKGRSTGREFPVWQFVDPVPELLEPVLRMMAELPNSEIHAFWVSASDELNALSPAEVLAGLPFETRKKIHPSQRRLLDQPTHTRVREVQKAAMLHARGMADIIS